MTTSQALKAPPADEPATDEFLEDALRGLGKTNKSLPSKYLYDRRGSDLFEQICETPEYYLTRVELALMESIAGDVARELGERVRLVEFGNGAGIKTRLLLSALRSPASYVPVEISGSALAASSRALSEAFPELRVQPLEADFTQPLELPPSAQPPSRTVVYLAGSTLGNFRMDQAADLLRQMRRTAGTGGALLLGLDLKKSPDVLDAAYNDEQGVTARFTLNLLTRMNRELDANFDLGSFEHRAAYSAEAGCVETDIVSRRDQQVMVGGRRFDFREGDAIRVEVSCKYSRDDIQRLAAAASLQVQRFWTDQKSYFAVVLLAVSD